MNVRETVSATARNGYRNLVGTIAVSLLVSLAVLPLVAMLLVGTPLAVLTGLWATSLLVGVVLVGGFRFATTVAERGVPIPVWTHVRTGIEAPRTGLTLGAITFLVGLVSIGVVSLVPPGLTPYAIGVASFVLLGWYLVVAFAGPELAEAIPLRIAFSASLARLVTAPSAAVFLLVLSFVCALVAGVTVVTVAFFLPGVLCLLAAHVTAAIDAERKSD